MASKGFTIVELLIVIVVIGILATMAVIAFSGIQKRATVTTLKSDLTNTAKLMAVSQAETGIYPGVLPGEVRASQGVSITLISTPGSYSGLTTVQTGVLFQTMCQQLINEGYGRGSNLGGGMEQYITNCNVYGRNSLQINGWDAHDFAIPIASTSIYDWYNSHISSDSWRPNKKQVYLDFASTLSSRYAATGGTFPVTSFWDPWANGSNGGVPQETLPAPTTGASSESFCVEAVHTKYPDTPWHITQNSTPALGACS